MESSRLKRNVFLLYLIKISHWCLFVMPIIVPFYHENGLSMTQIMLVQAAYSISIVVLEMPSGYASDVWGRRNTLIIGSVLGFVGWSMYGFAEGFVPILIAEIIMGVGISFISGTDSALLYDSLLILNRKDDYSRYEGRLSSIGNFAEAFAGIIGGYLAFISLRTPFYCQAGIAFIGIPASLLVFDPPVIRREERASVRDIWNIMTYSLHQNKALRNRIFFSALIGSATLTMAWLAQPAFMYFQIPMKIFNGALNLYSVIWTILNISVGITAWLAYRLDKQIGETKMAFFILFSVVIGFIGTAFSNVYFALLFIFLFYCVRGIATPVLKDYINRMVSSDIRATVLSIRNFIIRLTFSIVGPFIGWMSDRLDIMTGMIIAAIIYGISGMVFALLIWKEK